MPIYGQDLNYLNVDGSAFNDKSDAYKYPSNTRGKEWQELVGPDFDKRVEACQVPENVIKNLSDEGLVETCITYPINREIPFASNLQGGFKIIMAGSNAYEELFKRNENNKGDISKILLRKFIEIDVSHLGDEHYNANILKRIRNITFILAQESMLNTLSDIDKKNLVQNVLLKTANMFDYHDVYGDLQKE
jgi:hypothetical protein